jgi:hypothetical protein
MLGFIFHSCDPVDPTPLTPEELKLANEADDVVSIIFIVTTILFIGFVVAVLVF